MGLKSGYEDSTKVPYGEDSEGEGGDTDGNAIQQRRELDVSNPKTSNMAVDKRPGQTHLMLPARCSGLTTWSFQNQVRGLEAPAPIARGC